MTKETDGTFYFVFKILNVRFLNSLRHVLVNALKKKKKKLDFTIDNFLFLYIGEIINVIMFKIQIKN